MPRLNPVDRLSIFIGQRASYLFLAAVAITVYEVVMRYAFDAPTTWVHETTIVLSAIAFIIAGPYAQQAKIHIRISSVYDRMPPRVQARLEVVNLAIMLACLVLVGYGAAVRAGKSLALDERTGTASNLPYPQIVKTALAVGIALMIVQILVQLRARLRGRGRSRS